MQAVQGKITVSKAVIKGYHVYQVKPPMIDPPISLPVEMEYSNMKDPNACSVWMPKLEQEHSRHGN